MKKVYNAPEILFESFTMSTNIASDCDRKTNNPNNNDGCGILASGLRVFMSGMNGCSDIPVEIDGSYDSICYHVPSDGNMLFNS